MDLHTKPPPELGGFRDSPGADIIGGFPFADSNCKGCGKPLTIENAWMADGCPCNTALGVNSMNETRWRLLMQLQQEQSRSNEGGWIIDHALIDDEATYIVCAIGARSDKTTYLYDAQTLTGWQFKNRIAGCYAAIPMPQWKGLPNAKATT